MLLAVLKMHKRKKQFMFHTGAKWVRNQQQSYCFFPSSTFLWPRLARTTLSTLLRMTPTLNIVTNSPSNISSEPGVEQLIAWPLILAWQPLSTSLKLFSKLLY